MDQNARRCIEIKEVGDVSANVVEKTKQLTLFSCYRIFRKNFELCISAVTLKLN